VDTHTIAEFRRTVWNFYTERGRHDLPWRLPGADGSFDPYKILVSEIMLQQTQVSRVIPKYAAFLKSFPHVQALAAAPLGDVLAVWNGLGYNRRAKFLWQAAHMIVDKYNGDFPSSIDGLRKLPGVGVNTAGAVVVYSFNLPEPFIETNIRTVFIHHFFKDQTDVPDKEILGWVKKTLPDEKGKGVPEFASSPRAMINRTVSEVYMQRQNRSLLEESQNAAERSHRKTENSSHYREWYWALMDYGTFLKQTVGNLSRSSKGYAKQSKFAGSVRQLRGAIIRNLLEAPSARADLAAAFPDERLDVVLADLIREGLIREEGGHFSIH